MKRVLIFLLVLWSTVAMAQIPVPGKPAITEGLVIDYTKTLSAQEKEQLNRKLIAYDDSTSNQVAVVIMATTGDYPIEDVALQILRQWGVGGQEKKDNGIVILVAKDDRKVRIEVGYGLEGAIPDMVAASIIDHSILPSFKGGNYYKGLNDGTDAIIKAAAGEYKAPPNYNKKKKDKGIGIGQIVLMLAILVFLFGLGGNNKGGGMISRRGYRGWWGPVFPGGGWSGGSSGGGGWSGGGGGFGGFGGGSGGGGGASGSW